MAYGFQVSQTQRFRRLFLLTAALLVVVALGPVPTLVWADQAAAEIRVTQVRRVFHNGEHNAFTDLVQFKFMRTER